MDNSVNLKEAKDNRIEHHLDQEAKKYDRPTKNIGKKQIVSGEAIIHELNTQNITLLPFTFDDYGSMGPIVTSYFFEDNKFPTITDKKKLSKFPNSVLKTYNKGRDYLKTKKHSLFKSANKGWKLINKDRWYGNTYQLTSPSNWGRHYLAMNLNTAINQHIIKSFLIIDKSIKVLTENKTYKILGRQAIAHQGIEPNHRKTKNTKHPNPNPKQHTISVDPKVTKPYESFLSSINNSQQENEDKMQGKNSTFTTYLPTNTNTSTKSTTEESVETYKFE